MNLRSSQSSVSASNMLAIDLGAESGRAMLGHFDGTRLRMQEVHRFPNNPINLPNALHWNILGIYEEVLNGLAAGSRATAGDIASMGIDSWAVDFGLLDSTGSLVGNPVHYRDQRTEGMTDRAFERVSQWDLYRSTGIQSMPINTLCQLLAMEGDPQLSIANTMLLVPDLLRYWLTGERSSEYTVATTTQLYDHDSGDWAWPIIGALGIPPHLFSPLIGVAERGAPLRLGIASEASLSAIPVVPVASHDTASAVVAVPSTQPEFAYISSGTWSLVGTELSHPILSKEAMLANFTNEGGAFGTIRFLKNVMGLWLLQECRRSWQREGVNTTYEHLAAAATSATAFKALIDPDQPEFLGAGNMPEKIASFCTRTGQPVPADIGETTRTILESLALKYRWVIETLEQLSNRSLDVVHIVGGGSRNPTLCQFSANATQRPVIAGPAEATSIGNLLVQAVANGHLSGLTDIREVVRNSEELVTYEPQPDAGQWEDAYQRFLDLPLATTNS